MSQININIRMDADLKKQFEAFCNDAGLTMTTAMNIFAKTAVREQKIPFEVSTGRIPNAETVQAMEDVQTGENLSQIFDSTEDLMGDLISPEA